MMKHIHTPSRLTRLVVGITALALLSLGGCTTAGQEDTSDQVGATFEEILEKAKEEGSVTWYTSTGSDEILQKNLKETFEATYPGITLTIQHADEAKLLQTFYADAGRGESPDVMLGSAAMMQELNGNAFLAEYRPPIVDEAYSDEKFQLLAPFAYPSNITTLSVNWNSNLAPDLDPQNLMDVLLDPAYKGKIGVADPNTIGGAFGVWWALKANMTEQELFDFMDALGEQEVKPYTGNGPLTQAVASGEVTIGWLNNSSGVSVVQSGAPMYFRYPEGTAAGYGYMAVVKAGKHPNAARVLSEWFRSEEGQQVWGDYAPGSLPVHPDVIPSTGLEDLDWYISPDTSTMLFDDVPPTVQDKEALLAEINARVFKR